jgi:Protein of unknown function (DUF4244)
MYINDNPGGTAHANAGDEDFGNVREIFPGATALPRVRNESPWSQLRDFGSEAGMATAEYAIATLAAVGFAGLLVVILKSDEVRGFLLNIIRTALSF